MLEFVFEEIGSTLRTVFPVLYRYERADYHSQSGLLVAHNGPCRRVQRQSSTSSLLGSVSLENGKQLAEYCISSEYTLAGRTQRSWPSWRSG